MRLISPYLNSAIFSLFLVPFLGTTAAIAGFDTREFETFSAWCENREQLTLEQWYTVEVLLDSVEAEDCAQAEAQLNLEFSLSLRSRHLEALEPLASLSHLRFLGLSDNKITDISPLAMLTDLEVLWLHENQIQDLSPLSNLVKLELLDLALNEIVDIRPLSGLTQLVQLSLFGNTIENDVPLATLTNLKVLNLESSGITSLDAVSNLSNLTQLYLDFDQVDNWRSLDGLTSLTRLSVKQRPAADLPEPVRVNLYYRPLFPRFERDSADDSLFPPPPDSERIYIPEYPGSAVPLRSADFELRTGPDVD
ncbi:MAG: leucine-rich repeat domain-containing protein [Cyanobacteria bacterium P01_G01_bin.54]